MADPITIEASEIDRQLLIPTTEPGPGDQEIERSLTDMFCMIASPKDARGNRVRGWRKNDIPNKNHTFMNTWQEAPDGTHLANYIIFAAHEWKIDSATMTIEDNDAFIYLLAHSYLPEDIDPETGFRWSSMSLAVLEDVWEVPRLVIPSQKPGACIAPGNRPYFLRQNNVTRGQSAKIMALGLGLPLPTDGRQTFEDIPPSDPFYQYIEACYEAGLFNGYNCI